MVFQLGVAALASLNPPSRIPTCDIKLQYHYDEVEDFAEEEEEEVPMNDD